MNKLKSIFSIFTILTLVLSLSLSSCKKNNEDDDNDPEKKDYAVVIENGAQNIKPDDAINYSAYLVDKEGNKVNQTKSSEELAIVWSVSESAIATIGSNGAISVVTSGSITITATVTYEDEVYTATVPLGIYTPPTLFAVAPSAIIGITGDTYDFITIFLSMGDEPSYSYSSSNESIATVSASGVVTLTGTGLCNILVTASTMQDAPYYIPVCVVEIPELELPIVRVEVAPASADKFKGETAQFSAQAYDLEGSAVETTFSWNSLDPTIATVDANGLVTTKNVGSTYIQAIGKGIIGQAEIFVMPDTIIVVTPFWASIAAGSTQQFTAKAYNARTATVFTDIIDFTWIVPTYGMPMFDIATVNATGLVTMKSDATAGMMTFVLAHVVGDEELMGGATVMAAIAGMGCDCGEGNADVVDITTSSDSFILAMGGMDNIGAIAVDALGNEVSGTELVYCSDNEMVCTVSNGFISSVISGTATITICSGDISTTVTVTVN